MFISIYTILKTARHKFWDLGSFLSLLITVGEEQEQCFDEAKYILDMGM